MNLLPFYSGYTLASHIATLEKSAASLDLRETHFLNDFKIRIACLLESVAHGKKTLENSTIKLPPVLRQLAFLIQKIVFWCLGITALESSISRKQTDLELKKQIMEEKETIPEAFLVTKFLSPEGEYIPIILAPQPVVHGEVTDFAIVSKYHLKMNETVVMYLNSTQQASSLTALINTDDPNLTCLLAQIAIQFAKEEPGITRLEIEAGHCHDSQLRALGFKEGGRLDATADPQYTAPQINENYYPPSPPLPNNSQTSHLVNPPPRVRRENSPIEASQPSRLLSSRSKEEPEPLRPIWWADKTTPNQVLSHLDEVMYSNKPPEKVDTENPFNMPISFPFEPGVPRLTQLKAEAHL